MCQLSLLIGIRRLFGRRLDLLGSLKMNLSHSHARGAPPGSENVADHLLCGPNWVLLWQWGSEKILLVVEA
jgi:hypothetical protein